MNEVKERLEMAHYRECVKATLRTADRLGFTKIEQMLLLGLEIEAEDKWMTAKLDILKWRNIDIEKRAEYLLKIAARLDEQFDGDTAKVREWLETAQGKVQHMPVPRELLLSTDAGERLCVALMLR